jgi:hypothetical protein
MLIGSWTARNRIVNHATSLFIQITLAAWLYHSIAGNHYCGHTQIRSTFYGIPSIVNG